MCERCADLELELRVVTAERDMLLEEKQGMQRWLGQALRGTPMDPIHQKPDPNKELADRLAEEYPDKKIMAIKELRTQSGTVSPNGGALGLKEAKDYMDAAYARRERAKMNATAGPPF